MVIANYASDGSGERCIYMYIHKRERGVHVQCEHLLQYIACSLLTPSLALQSESERDATIISTFLDAHHCAYYTDRCNWKG